MMNMRKFVISDLHGDREMYHIIISYLENIALLDDVTLIINGNLIDGMNTLDLLEDVSDRMMNQDSIQIQYLGGNQELQYYQKLLAVDPNNEWTRFLGNLNTSCLLEEGIYYRRIMIAHGDIPKSIFPLKIQDNNDLVFDTVARRVDMIDQHFSTRRFRGAIGRCEMKHHPFFFIKGGTPVHNADGFFYNGYEHYLTIDGGCKNYLEGDDSFDHVPLVEIEDDKLTFLIFNHQNEIINGYHFSGQFKKLSEEELAKKSVFLGTNEIENHKIVKELR